MVTQAAMKARTAGVEFGPELEFSGLGGMFHHRAHAARQAADDVADVKHAEDDQDHLEKIGEGDRPHAAE
ncbi:hypothetical protein SCD_n00305 [Sulfuricella denitrificans skB26]|uniref:Uncharacterized protein n=1 Tax=Sulfuricella denitrificans (strain DSM 22764 / NBRC 105220 / skB26) TaxID=1163617 RepID=S6AHZ7_SULDS|nr:hypothetical protein SCD_n00305 [Sulfuricella denitrificans skB26]